MFAIRLEGRDQIEIILRNFRTTKQRQNLGFIENMEYLNFKNLPRKRIYSKLEEEYENQLNQRRRKNDDLEARNGFMVKSVLSSAAVLKHTKVELGLNPPKKHTQNKK